MFMQRRFSRKGSSVKGKTEPEQEVVAPEATARVESYAAPVEAPAVEEVLVVEDVKEEVVKATVVDEVLPSSEVVPQEIEAPAIRDEVVPEVPAAVVVEETIVIHERAVEVLDLPTETTVEPTEPKKKEDFWGYIAEFFERCCSWNKKKD